MSFSQLSANLLTETFIYRCKTEWNNERSIHIIIISEFVLCMALCHAAIQFSEHGLANELMD